MNKRAWMLWLAAGAVTDSCAEAVITGNLVAGYNSAYIWRGVNFSTRNQSDSDMFYTSLNLAGALTSRTNWNATFWMADFGTDKSGNGLERGKIEAGLSRKFGDFTLATGLIRYYLIGVTGSTSEFYVAAAASYGGLDFKSTLYYDIEYNKGNIFSILSVSKGFDIAEGTRLTLEAYYNDTLSGYANSYYSVGLVAAVKKQLTERVSGRVYFAGEITEGHPFDGDDLYGGASLTFGF